MRLSKENHIFVNILTRNRKGWFIRNLNQNFQIEKYLSKGPYGN